MLNEYSLVTVISVCYNHERYVVECLDGIRGQTYPNIQWIIVDDCSKDRSVGVISSWMETHKVDCSFIAHDVNMGLPRTLNEALKIADGKYISIVSTDDVWLPGFIEDRVGVLENVDETFGLAYGKSIRIDENGDILPGLFQECKETPSGYALEQMIKGNFIAANSVLIRKSCYDKIGRYDESLILEDYDMWIRIGRAFNFAYSQNVLSKYRVLKNSLDHANREKMYENVTRILLRTLNTNPEYKSSTIERLIAFRNLVYNLGHPVAPLLYLKALQRKFRKKDLLLWVLSQIGIPYRIGIRFIKQS